MGSANLAGRWPYRQVPRRRLHTSSRKGSQKHCSSTQKFFWPTVSLQTGVPIAHINTLCNLGKSELPIINVDSSSHLTWDCRSARCALGRAGIVCDKREGDGGTPSGILPIRRVLYRPDRMVPPETAVPISALEPDDGWCNDPTDSAYNYQVKLPYPASCETLWRVDHLYDVIGILGYNDDPVIPDRGSAIFLHVANSDYGPTEGCIALSLADLKQLLGRIDLDSSIRIR
jgi:L,D-peptidoglycan transpeptidase YkuD (ErfK/YbiS/YcfS/YnhG family)